MVSVPFGDVVVRYPALAEQVLGQLNQVCEGVKVDQVDWYLVDCSDDPDAPLNETAAAELMLRGQLQSFPGIRGTIGRHFACCCDADCGGTKLRSLK